MPEGESLGTNEVAAPRLISTASVTLTLPMRVPHLPAEGTSVTASSSYALVGDGFVVLSAAARQGVHASLASPLGTGANSHAVRAALIEEGISLAMPDMVGDTGMSISLIQSDGLMTTVRSPGVEADPQLSDLRQIPLKPGDVVYVSGLDLVSKTTSSVLITWLKELPHHVTIVFSLGGAVDVIPLSLLTAVIKVADIVTMNMAQAEVFKSRMMIESIWAARGQIIRNDAVIVARYGKHGSVFQSQADQNPVRIHSLKQSRVDTTGVGDTHTGVMIAGLMQGRELPEAIMRANIAASVAVSKFGAAVCPTAIEIDQLIAQKGLSLENLTESYTGTL
ncbi:hypothetical protein BM477_04595 [Boudabousia marimammalium]|uniref:Carbohydrate kinase PfkB domain-containing protein n=2 Tax=Boudabousia marimammalium TaxID=156892 RepID=A0A1Q5PPD8_9ACTO|nr:hypothetical protein BM477_04595 [Boudabousia marimammalium]